MMSLDLSESPDLGHEPAGEHHAGVEDGLQQLHQADQTGAHTDAHLPAQGTCTARRNNVTVYTSLIYKECDPTRFDILQ